MQGRTRRWLTEGVLAALVLVAAVLVSTRASAQVSVQIDEPFNMGSSRFFYYLFVERDVTKDEWGDHYYTHTHPMLSRYLVGGSFWFSGVSIRDFPPLFYYRATAKFYRERGPAFQAMLAQARVPFMLLTVGVLLLVYLLGRLLGGAVAGLAAAALALTNPLALTWLPPALTEAPLTFLLLLGLLLGIAGSRRGHAGSLPVSWAVALGIVLGLCLQAKLTALLSLAAVLGWVGLVMLAAALRRRPKSARACVGGAWSAGRGWLLATVLALGVFVATNPHLYPNPIEHTAHLLRQRIGEQAAQQRGASGNALHDPRDKLAFVFGGSFVSWTTSGSLGLPFEAGLAVLGTAVLLVAAWRTWRADGHPPAEGLFLLTVAAYLLGASLLIHARWDRYLTQTTVLGTILSGVGFAALFEWLRGAVRAAISSRQAPAPRDRASEQGLPDPTAQISEWR